MSTPPAAQDPSLATEIRFLEGVARRCPDHVPTLKALGDLLTQVGRIEDGLDVDRKLILLAPDESEVWYNLGCSLSLCEQVSEAIEVLTRAVALGYNDADWMENDDDLAALREHTAFLDLVRACRAEKP